MAKTEPWSHRGCCPARQRMEKLADLESRAVPLSWEGWVEDWLRLWVPEPRRRVTGELPRPCPPWALPDWRQRGSKGRPVPSIEKLQVRGTVVVLPDVVAGLVLPQRLQLARVRASLRARVAGGLATKPMGSAEFPPWLKLRPARGALRQVVEPFEGLEGRLASGRGLGRRGTPQTWGSRCARSSGPIRSRQGRRPRAGMGQVLQFVPARVVAGVEGRRQSGALPWLGPQTRRRATGVHRRVEH
jgi:hypothetical protein